MLPHTLSFLVVEDHEFQRAMLVKMLKGLNAKSIYTAADGRAALELLRTLDAPPDVIISDLDMPVMDGMELMRHIGAARSGASLIVASALERNVLSSVETMATAYGINFLGTIEKPVTPVKLEELILVHKRAPGSTAAIRVNSPIFLAEEIVEGLENNEFESYFQPKIEIATGRVIGAEALARWRHPREGLLPPYAFIKPLEDAGKIDALMRCMLTKGARFCRALQRSGHDCTVAVNLSVTSLSDVRVADQITEIVRKQEVDTRHIVLEITESAATTDLGQVLENLARLRMKGFELAIDDYGTGYSSLEQLTRIPFTELKIDQSFVTHAGRQESAKVILASSLDMARRLHLRAVAEGVETRANWDLLVQLGCDVAQGYYISKPMAAAAYIEWLTDWPKMQCRTHGGAIWKTSL